MLKTFIKFFTPPSFSSDENKTRVARYLHWIALAFMAAILSYELISKAVSGNLTFNLFDMALTAVFLVIFTIWSLSKSGNVRLASSTLIIILWLAVNASAFFGLGIRDSAYIANFLVLLASGLLIGWQAAVILSVLTIFSGIGLAYAEVNGLSLTTYDVSSPLAVIPDMVVIFSIFAVFMFLLITGLENAIKIAQAGTRELESANHELSNARIRLEKNRNELLVANQQLVLRAERIRTISNISKTITLVQEIDRLLTSVVNTISQQFGYYHAGIFLVDDQKKFALLRASSSDGGLRMIKQGHQIRISRDTIIGLVAQRGEARIASNEGFNAVGFNNPELPATRSQLVLPLKVKELVIGALDIQSDQPNAFSEEDVSILQILADQVAIAIQNSRSSEQAAQSLQKAEIATQQLTNTVWKGYKETIEPRGYRYNGVKPEPLKDTGNTVTSTNSLSIPVQLRGHTIGRLKLNPPGSSRRWTEDEIAIAESTAERIAIALEGARLLEDAQKRASRETFLADISAKLGTSFQLDSILRDTVEELGQKFKNTLVSFQLINPSSPPAPKEEAQTMGHSTPQNGKDTD
ncbi:MAG TPA: GAF domain-containing protein [Anaerolineales bacterium]|nr:GAF domain-containing protein [Anaerolineales bacterium]